MMVTMLRRAGYRVAEAASATDAISQWYERQYGFDLLLTDYLLPGGRDGAQLAAQFLKDKPSLRVIVMSGYATTPGGVSISLPDHIVRLPKPFRTRALLDAVRMCADARPPGGATA
jgi:DNA-binding NtrC family response regulator